MKIEISINGERRPYGREADHWISQALAGNQRTDFAIIYLDSDQVNLALSNPASAVDDDDTISRRPLSMREREITRIWNQLGLDDGTLTGEVLITFLHYLKP